MKVLLVLLSLLIFSCSSLIKAVPRASMETNLQELRVCADPPLEINGNTELADAASSGDGSSGNPYIIQNKVINASGLAKNGIYIQNTNAHFILRNCNVTGTDVDYVGIRLDNVTNARLENNNIYNNGDSGILLWESYMVQLTGNTVFNHENNSGIGVSYCEKITLTDNVVYYSKWAIYLYYSNDSVLSDNTVYNNSMEGIHLNCADNNTVTRNTAYNNTNNGIYLYYADNNTLSNNTAYCNRNAGISLMNSHNNTLFNNVAYNNSQWGVRVGLGMNNMLINNTVINNHIDGFYLWFTEKNTLMNNTAIVNTNGGIYLYNSDNNTLIGNLAVLNDGGIYLWSSDYNLIKQNKLYNNSYCIFEMNSTGNVIIDNDCVGAMQQIPGLNFAWIIVVVFGLSIVKILWKKPIKSKESL